jgi:hypothetical protein
MAEERGAENETPWWRTVPAILTAVAAFIGSVTALLALFIGPVGGDRDETTPPTTTTAETSSVPSVNKPFAEDDVQKLLTMVPASIQGRCKQAPEEGIDSLARLSCSTLGTRFAYPSLTRSCWRPAVPAAAARSAPSGRSSERGHGPDNPPRQGSSCVPTASESPASIGPKRDGRSSARCSLVTSGRTASARWMEPGRSGTE